MDPVKGIHDLVYLTGLIDPCDTAPPSRRTLFIEFQEDLGTRSLTLGEAVENGQGFVFGEGPQFVEKISGGTVEAHIDDGPVLCLGGLDEVHAEHGGQTACIIMPNHIIANIEPAKKAVQLTDS
jgi:hypothetical protein